MRYVIVAIVVVAVVLYAVIVLIGARIDGRRQTLLKKGLHPVTTPEGKVEAREYQHGTDSTGERNGTTDHQG
jgi:hypothetical protein